MRPASYITKTQKQPFGRTCTLADPYIDTDEEEYDDYNTDDPTPIDEEPDYDTDEEFYLLYRNNILIKMN